MPELRNYSDKEIIDTDMIGEDITPDASPLLESNRNLGYSIEEAVSDLIDNSITAEATEVHIEYKWNKGNPIFSLRDNGSGMDVGELVNGFKLGSKNPLEERDPKDLGRFGFGMKTASLSQARKLIAITKKHDHSTICRALDLTFIQNSGKWALLKFPEDSFTKYAELLESSTKGTVIIWEDWDRAAKNERDFSAVPKRIMNYLSVCFHRFLEKASLKIYCNGLEIFPVSPIPDRSTLFSTIHLAENRDTIQMAYILQHPRHWKEDFNNSRNFNSHTLFNGFETQQGIYIYRCDRLLTPHGGWLGLVRQANAAKLARVTIDYPNNADHLWSLDITKTNASIPLIFKDEIERLISKGKNESVRITSQAQNINRRRVRESYDHSLIWKQTTDTNLNCYRYTIDTEHPLFQNLVKENKVDKKTLQFFSTLVSDNLPVAKIIENNDENPSYHDRMVRDEELPQGLLSSARQLFELFKISMTKAEALRQVYKIEPYCYHQEQIKRYLND
ncbi:ATP-binding protein [Bacteroidota bacterium]